MPALRVGVRAPRGGKRLWGRSHAVPPLGEAHRLVHPLLLLLVHTVRNALSLSLSYDRDSLHLRGIERIASERSEEYASHIVQIYPRTP